MELRPLSTRNSNFIFIPFLSVVLTSSMSVADGVVNVKASQKIAAGNIKFCNHLYKKVSEKDGNVFISPFSVEVVLALAYMGAQGDTAEEIAKALDLPTDKNEILDGFRSLMNTLRSTETMTLEVANKVYTMKNYEILKEFHEIAEKYFLSGAQELDFSNGEASRKAINSWVEEKTRNKIKDLIPSGLLNDLTRLVLVNAIYFKGLWVNQFDPNHTKPEKFHLNSKEHKEIPMMHKKADFGYLESEELDSKVLEMPYKGHRNLSMFVILPNDVDGISKLEERLQLVDLSKLLNHLPRREVVVTMPKFKLEESTDLNGVLQALGMNTMFSIQNADFSGISGRKELFVSKVLQKAFIEVNEEGSEAAAATVGAVRMKRSLNVSTETHKFIANHPFKLLVSQRDSNFILFMGKFTIPASQAVQHEEL